MGTEAGEGGLCEMVRRDERQASVARAVLHCKPQRVVLEQLGRVVDLLHSHNGGHEAAHLGDRVLEEPTEPHLSGW